MVKATRWCWPVAIVLLVPIGREPVLAAGGFVRGDSDESGKLEITDAIRTLLFLFQGKGDSVRCLDAADTDDDGSIAVSDAILGLNYLFRSGREPPPPYPACGMDPSTDDIACDANDACAGPISFFDITLEADGAFFVVDRSGTFTSTGGLGLAKRAVVESRTPDLAPAGIDRFFRQDPASATA